LHRLACETQRGLIHCRKEPAVVLKAVLLSAALVPLLAWATPAHADPANFLDKTGKVAPPVNNAYILAGAAEAAYLKVREEQSAALYRYGFDREGFINESDSDTQVLFASAPGVFVVAVRGSQENDDWWRDGAVQQREPDWKPGIQIHRGFLNAADSVYAGVLAQVRQAEREHRAIIFTGHSLGGCIAQILAFRAALDGVGVDAVVTFGQPRVGDGPPALRPNDTSNWKAQYEALLGKRTSRLVNDSDWMVCYPPLWWYDPAGPMYTSKFRGPLEASDETDCRVTQVAEDHRIDAYIGWLSGLVPDIVRGQDFATNDISSGAATRGQIGDEIERAWSHAWTAIVPYQVGGKYFSVLHDATTGRLDLVTMTADGKVGAPVEKRLAFAPNSMITTLTYENQTFLFVSNMWGNVARYAFRADGSLCTTGAGACPEPRSFGVGEGVGFGNALVLNPYNRWDATVLGDRGVLLFLDKTSGKVATYDVSSSHFGDKLYESDWSGGWTSARFFRSGSKTFLFLLKEATGAVKVLPVSASGRPGDAVHQYDWSSGWTSVLTYDIGGHDFLMLLKAGDGKVHVHELGTDGSVGEQIGSHDWTSGWRTAAVVPSSSTRRSLVLVKP
jgi:hypothetical protein